MKNLKAVDVVIAGGGWTGLAMAKEIVSRTSLKVRVLERGLPRKTSDYSVTMDELDYAIRLRMMQNIAEETITHRHSPRETAAPVRQYGSFLPGAGTGGAGEHWMGMAWRFLPDQFTLRTHLTEKHGAKNLPEDLAVEDWGVTYDDLEKHYWYAERMMGVSGKAGNVRGKLIDGGNIFEGPREQEYPLPPLKQSYLTTMFDGAARRLGYHPFPIPAATISEAYTNPDGVSRAGCAYCGYCERFGCMVGAKSQPTNTLMPVLARHKNFEIQNGAWVRRVVHENGRATGVHFMDANGEDCFQPAEIVVLGSWTLNNVRLLYLSKIGTPYDPETRRGTLGRNLTHQVNGGGARMFFDKPLNLFMGSGALGLRFCDFDGSEGFKEGDGILRGGSVGLGTAGNRPIASFGNFPEDATRARWGSEWKKASLEWRDRGAAVGLSGEHLAYRQNYMDLDPTYADKYGDPLLRFTLDWTPHEFRVRDYFSQLAVKVAKEMGAKVDPVRPASGRYNTISYQSTHIQGGVIMGASPEKSVLNTYLQHWDVPNLFVVGASAFPQNASMNPTLTVLAVTYRAADALIGRYLKNPGRLA